jgi:hypothetical protein
LTRLSISLLIVLTLVTAVDPAGGAQVPPLYLLGPEGKLFVWTPERETVEPISLPWERVNDLAPFDQGKRLVLLADHPAASDHHGTVPGGLLVVMEAAGPSLRPILQAPFQGLGLRTVVSDEKHRAFVLAARPARTGSNGAEGRALVGANGLILAFDLEKGRLIESLPLPAPAASIALGAGGRRLFVALPDRILTCTTEPLGSSWLYRSPGMNLGVSFPPGSGVLYVARGREAAIFDPERIASRSEEERATRTDDASSVVALPDSAAAFLFTEDGRGVIAFGGTSHISFLDPRGGVARTGRPVEPIPAEASLVRPIRFRAETGGVLAATFPGGRVLEVSPPPFEPAPPPTPPPGKSGTAETPATTPPAGAPAPLTPAVVTPPAASPPVIAPPATSGATTPEAAASPRPVAEPVLRGRMIGDSRQVAAIVVFGPDSILNEQVRTQVDPAGEWSVPLPPPGTYRIVPVGRGSRPLRTIPNFQTVIVRKDEGIAGIEFRIEATR